MNRHQRFFSGLILGILLILLALGVLFRNIIAPHQVNTITVSTNKIEKYQNLIFNYPDTDIILHQSTGHKLLIKESLTQDQRSDYSTQKSKDKTLSFSSPIGKWHLLSILLPQQRQVEITIPKSYTKNISITGSNGTIDTSNLTINQQLKIKSQSGIVLMNSVSAANITTTSISGDIRFSALNGALALTTDSGDINGQLKTGEGSITSNSGDMRLDISHFSNELTLTTKSGNQQVNTTPKLSFNYRVKVNSGNFTTSSKIVHQQIKAAHLNSGYVRSKNSQRQLNMTVISGNVIMTTKK